MRVSEIRVNQGLGVNPKDLIIAFILSFFKNNFSEIIPLHCYDGMHFSVSCSFVKKKYMASRFWIAYFLLSGSDENWSKASSILSTLPVLLFRPQKNKLLLIYPSRCLRDLKEPKTKIIFHFSRALFKKILFLYFFLHKSWIWRTLGCVMENFSDCHFHNASKE